MLTEDIPVDVGRGFPMELTPQGYLCWIVKILLECSTILASFVKILLECSTLYIVVTGL